MKKRTIVIVLLIIVAIPILVVALNWSSVRDQVIRRLKSQIRQDFLAQQQQSTQSNILSYSNSDDKFSFAIVTDVHNSTKQLKEAVAQINTSPVQFVLGLGDYTNVGTTQEFNQIKQPLNSLHKPYYLLPGDHDLWNGRDKTEDAEVYFNQVFPDRPQNHEQNGVQLLFIDNADLYQGVNATELAKFKEDLLNTKAKTIIISSHKAITHPLTIHRMGYINETRNEAVIAQAEDILQAIKDKKNAKIILLSGDLHSFSKYTLPTDSFEGYTIGALTETKNFQTPRYAIVHITKNNEVVVEDKPLD